MRHLPSLALLGCSLIAASPPAAKTARAAAAAGVNPHRALVNRYCVTCHNKRLKTAKLEFDTLDLAHPEKDALTWERAIRKLRGGMMPPPGALRPPLAEVNALATYLEDSLDKAGVAAPNPGHRHSHRHHRHSQRPKT